MNHGVTSAKLTTSWTKTGNAPVSTAARLFSCNICY